jgi:hypothetical protein
MAKKVNAPSAEGATSNEVEETTAVENTEVVGTEVEETTDVENTEVVAAEVVNETEVIASDVFVAEDGTKVEFAVKHFIYAKRKYTVAEAVAEIPEALQELYERKSFIFKKV